MEDLNEVVGRKIQSRLEELNMTQADLARELNISRQVVNKIVNGRKNITFNEARKIAKKLGMDVNKLADSKTDEIEEQKNEPILAFMGEVDSKEAKLGLEKARDVMELIIFHKDVNENKADIFKDMEEI
ncbi:helix-turn-helix domain-containing protein [Halarsenatibacter silvermanii]|uniref:Phage-associated protein, BcepMu gp16 family n=1 Tax=Halarsenatibacter silvermanii TaxID=321763 RepID=A0A1G9GWF2_9FIRM|nr:helix-turn-helix transcriptional regulator [Halarsenatibacter silvermanii]SDL05019.1 phage-associated protein, BcepMu gp16 family [Halarsenatibacter silvermanii]